MRLVSDQQILASSAQAEKLLDFHIVDIVVDRLIQSMQADLQNYAET
jgi:hypothetical protein